MAPPILDFEPPLLNSACPWATTAEDLRQLLLSKWTGAVTTRTSLLEGFDHDDSVHRYLFFDPASARPGAGTGSGPESPASANDPIATASLNSLGYSPIVLQEYLSILGTLASEMPEVTKTIIISVTGSAEEVLECYEVITKASTSTRFPLAIEINLSCPNIPGHPPPAYDGPALSRYLSLLPESPELPLGIKTPPYTYHAQFATLVEELRSVATKISFVTATNTLGSCLVLDPDTQLPGQGFGGMAGSALHPLALGNVATIRRMLDEIPSLSHIRIIGVGGVSDVSGYERFKKVGAFAVAVGTALGKQGVDVFEKIGQGINA